MQIRKWLFHFGGTYWLPSSLGSYHGIFFNTAVREGDFVDLCFFTHPSLMGTVCVCLISHRTFHTLSHMYVCLPTCLPVCYLHSWQAAPFSGFHSFCQTFIVLLKKPVEDGFRILQGCSVSIPEARDWKQYGVWLYPNVINSNAEFCVQFCVLIWSWLVCADKEQLPFFCSFGKKLSHENKLHKVSPF